MGKLKKELLMNLKIIQQVLFLIKMLFFLLFSKKIIIKKRKIDQKLLNG